MLRRYPTPRAHYLALQRNLSVARNGFDRMRFCDCRRPLRGSDQRRIDSVLARATPRGHGSANMPSLSRFIILFAFVSAFGYGIMVVLANWPQPVQRQIVVRIPEERFSKAGRRALGPLETQKSDRLAGVLEELKLQH